MKEAAAATLGLAMLFAAVSCRDPHEVAVVNGRRIFQSEVAVELRRLLWRHGESWPELSQMQQAARRKESVDHVITHHLLADFCKNRAIVRPSAKRESEEEYEQFLKQFPPPDDWKDRIKLQGLDETALRQWISEETSRLGSIESWLAEQPGKVTESDARAWFVAHPGEMTIPERVRAGHIFLTRHDKEKSDREPEIRELHRRLTVGEATFEGLAMTQTDDESAKRRDGDLGWFTRARVPAEFADKAFSQSVGEIGAPFQSHLGWHILRVKERQPQRAATFEEMKNEITAMLDQSWREAAVRRLVEELRSQAKVKIFEDRMAAINPD